MCSLCSTVGHISTVLYVNLLYSTVLYTCTARMSLSRPQCSAVRVFWHSNQRYSTCTGPAEYSRAPRYCIIFRIVKYVKFRGHGPGEKWDSDQRLSQFFRHRRRSGCLVRCLEQVARTADFFEPFSDICLALNEKFPSRVPIPFPAECQFKMFT